MSVHGLYGLRKNNKDKCTFINSGAEPNGLGRSVTDFCKKHTIKELNTMYDRIKLVEEFEKPTKPELKNLEKMKLIEHDQAIISDFWYWTLGDFVTCNGLNLLYEYTKKYKQMYMMDHACFIEDSWYCEYAYIINLDENVVEIWKGRQAEPDEINRYGNKKYKETGYYPCKLIQKIDLAALCNGSEVNIEEIN